MKRWVTCCYSEGYFPKACDIILYQGMLKKSGSLAMEGKHPF